MNQALQQKIGDMQIHSATEGKGSTETVSRVIELYLICLD